EALVVVQRHLVELAHEPSAVGVGALGVGVAVDAQRHDRLDGVQVVLRADRVELRHVDRVLLGRALGYEDRVEAGLRGVLQRVARAPGVVAAREQVRRLRPGQRGDVLEAAPPTLVGGVLGGEQQLDDLPVLPEPRRRLPELHLEAVVLALGGPAPEAQDELGVVVHQVVEDGDLLGHPDGVVPRQHHHAGADAGTRDAAGEVGELLQRSRRLAVAGEVVLDRPDAVEPVTERQLAAPDLVAEKPRAVLGPVEALLPEPPVVLSDLVHQDRADLHADLLRRSDTHRATYQPVGTTRDGSESRARPGWPGDPEAPYRCPDLAYSSECHAVRLAPVQHRARSISLPSPRPTTRCRPGRSACWSMRRSSCSPPSGTLSPAFRSWSPRPG